MSACTMFFEASDVCVTRLWQISDVSVHEPLAVFTSLLVARHSLSLEEIIIHVALPLALCDFCE